MEPAGEPPRSAIHRPTLILNRSWIPIHVTHAGRAIAMLFRETARVVATDTLATHDFWEWIQLPVDSDQPTIRTPSLRIRAPEVVVLGRFNRLPSHQAPLTRRNLHARDRGTCQYCGKVCTAREVTVDHVVPRSKGGGTSWENCVTACRACNARKGDRRPQDVGLRLRKPPDRPPWSPFLHITGDRFLPSWSQFTKAGPAGGWAARSG